MILKENIWKLLSIGRVFFLFVLIYRAWERIYMEIKTGYLYHIKDEFFEIYDDENLMTNHDVGERDQHILLLKMTIYYGLFL